MKRHRRQLISTALLAGLFSLPTLAKMETVEEFYGHFGSGDPRRQSITINLINAVVSETSIAACGTEGREDFIKYPANVGSDFTDIGMVAYEWQRRVEDTWLDRPATEFLRMIYADEWGKATCPNKRRLG